MSATRLTLLQRCRGASAAVPGLELWLDCRAKAEPWAATWNAVPRADYALALAELAGVPAIWVADAQGRVAAETAAERLRTAPGGLACVHAVGAAAARSAISAAMVSERLRAERVA